MTYLTVKIDNRKFNQFIKIALYELKNIIKYANRNRIKLIGIMSKKKSLLYKSSNIKLLIPEVKESGYGIVPTSSTTSQLALGDAIAICLMQQKKFGKLDFKKFHPSGNLGTKLITVEEIMLTGNKIPFINENKKIREALKLITEKKLGILIAKNKSGNTTGILTDGAIRKFSHKKSNLQDLKVKKIMTKNPINVSKDTLAVKALSLMNSKKITSLCINKGYKKTIGVLHIHNILEANIK